MCILPGCSIETALQLLLYCIYSMADGDRPASLVAFNLSSAFDNIDHAVLLKRPSCSFGVNGSVQGGLKNGPLLKVHNSCI